MAYCTKEQVADEFNGIAAFSSTTNPTGDTVDRWIAEADALINAKVGLRYITPIVAANDLLVIRIISIMLVSARVRRRLNRQGPDGETSKVKVADTLDQAMKMLESIVKGTTNLDGGSVLKSAGGSTNSYQVNHAVSCPHTFRKDCDQW
jgi:hypothetical protein